MEILIIVQRSNGDVFLSEPLIRTLKLTYPDSSIDILVNADTVAIAKTLQGIRHIHTYDYGWKRLGKWERIKKEWDLIRSIRGGYDLAINLTTSDRSVLYAILAGKRSFSAIEADGQKSWWKKLFLTDCYTHDASRHIVRHNLMPLELLGIESGKIMVEAAYDPSAANELKSLGFNIDEPFIIFHPGAQYDYKIYPKLLRDKLLKLLDSLNIPIVITGGNSEVDRKIASELPSLPNLYNAIGKTSLNGYIALCDRANAYIGMDTLNMHIASALNKPVFAIFGPSLTQIWSPWSNATQEHASMHGVVQRYGNITLFQADMPCVPCGKAGCDDRHGKSDCLDHISPEVIFNEVAHCPNLSASRF